MTMSSLPVPPLVSSDQWRRKMDEVAAEDRQEFKISAMYSSVTGMITADMSCMQVPLSDHMVHRGHGVYDTATVCNGKVVGSTPHITRIIQSAGRAHIWGPLGEEEEKELFHYLQSLILSTVAASGEKNAAVRYWISAGGNDFAIGLKKREMTSFSEFLNSFRVFIVVLGGITWPSLEGVEEVTISEDEVPMKPASLAECKSVNYLLNVRLHLLAQQKGGSLGIWVRKDGRVAELAIMNLMAVKGNVVKIPAWDNILKGCTVRQMVAYCAEFGLEVQQGSLQKSELFEADELISVGGDVHIEAIVKLDGEEVGGGKPGKLYGRLVERMRRRMEQGEGEDVLEVPYKSYV